MCVRVCVYKYSYIITYTYVYVTIYLDYPWWIAVWFVTKFLVLQTCPSLPEHKCDSFSKAMVVKGPIPELLR